ncbi:hypothetical protein FRC14_000869 [Serendipita sp. 396]|nr:hypothetical protein FRC14_000869 [Serendipita sp. 396]KAG8766162.1 hypothetical protein FRC15_006543 [Serendipita sp. 397]KAG8771374.1 hypothetical protein FRC16_005942 [Serendipita sp. 398]KAG8818654.1 hypothetical protein FRC19_010416 [Serendipita sp. 401]KAG8837842.1 hypothetical protein FRC20_006576 [Serendipita sp. 405]KAG9051738.1 hypothetical protein FS842_011104 [Serendipita sp. 407]
MTLPLQSRRFCFCIPVRFGVFVLSFWSLIASGVVAGVVWIALAKGPENHVQFATNLKIGLIVAGVLYSLFALISLAGLVGSLIRSRALVRTFAVFLWFQLFASLAYSIAFAVALFDKPLQNHLVQECIKQTNATVAAIAGAHNGTVAAVELPANVTVSLTNGTESHSGRTSDEITEGCRSIFNTSKALFFVSFSLFFIITLYCCIIVRRYGRQLTEEQLYLATANADSTTQAAFQPSYYPHTPLSRVEPGYGAAGMSNPYPFAQRENGFGSNRNSQNK